MGPRGVGSRGICISRPNCLVLLLELLFHLCVFFLHELVAINEGVFMTIGGSMSLEFFFQIFFVLVGLSQLFLTEFKFAFEILIGGS